MQLKNGVWRSNIEVLRLHKYALRKSFCRKKKSMYIYVLKKTQNPTFYSN